MKSAQIIVLIMLIIGLCGHIRRDCKQPTEREISISIIATLILYFSEMVLFYLAGTFSQLLK